MERREGIVRYPQLGVRHGVVQIDEERTWIISLDECRRLFRKKVVHVIAIDVGGHPLAVAPQMIGELPMRMTVIEEPEGVVEPLSIGLAGGARLPESPFADH